MIHNPQNPWSSGVAADYFDGHSARRQPVILFVGVDGRLRIQGIPAPTGFRLEQVRIEPRVGDMPRVLRLPDGGLLQTSHNDAVDLLLSRQGRGVGQRLVHRLESVRGFILLALLLAVGFTWLLVDKGVPWLSLQAVMALPRGMDTTLGQQGLDMMDKGGLLAPTTLKTAERARVERVFRSLAVGEASGMTLVLRKSDKLGANALALPSGIIVVTDALARRLGEEQELLAVLAHETGHVVGRHTLRQLLQNSVVTLLLVSWTGDVQSFSSLVSGLPTLLLHMNYSREFEREADRHAVAVLKQRGLPASRLVSALEKLHEKREGEGENAFFSTHPGWEERKAVIEEEDQATTGGS